MKLGLGTAQFGLRYGVSNVAGQVTPAEVEKILTLASGQDIQVIDTASLYGDSEKVLGECLPAHHRFNIVTKTPQFKKPVINRGDAENLTSAFQESLAKLRQSRVYGLLLHNAVDMLAEGGDRLVEAMHRLKELGLVKRIGVSVYTPEQARKLPVGLDLVQLPLNILDQRMLTSATLDWLRARSVEVHARSVFLQGLLLMPPDSLPEHLAGYAPLLLDLRSAITDQGLTPLQAALHFVNTQPTVDTMIVGVCSRAELESILRSMHTMPKFRYDFSRYSQQDTKLIDPSCWSRLSTEPNEDQHAD